MTLWGGEHLAQISEIIFLLDSLTMNANLITWPGEKVRIEIVLKLYLDHRYYE